MNCQTDAVLDVLDAAYALEVPTDRWLEAMATRLDAALGDGSGSLTMVADLSGDAHPVFEHTAAIGDQAFWQAQLGLFRQMPTAMMRSFGQGPVFYWSQTAAAVINHDAKTKHLVESSAKNAYGTDELDAIARVRSGRAEHLIERLVLTALGPYGRGISAMFPQRSVAAKKPSAAELTIWGRVAAHVATAHRLRDGEHATEAVLTPGGKLLDATGPATLAREALREAAVSQDRARSRRGRKAGAEQATTDWQAIVSGRWSLVDQFERDGRRFLVAKVNEPLAMPRGELTPRETQVAELAARGYANKLIAYELGVSITTVVRTLASASAKLGATSRIDLIQRMSARA